MKKTLQYLTQLTAILLIGLLTGCHSGYCYFGNTDPRGNTETTAVFIRLVDSEFTTRGSSEHIPDGTFLEFNDGYLFLATEAGIIRQRYTIIPTGLVPVDVANRTICRNALNDGVTIPVVPGDVRRVIIVGNYESATAMYNSGNVSAVGRRGLDIISQHDALNVNLFGEEGLVVRTIGILYYEYPINSGIYYRIWDTREPVFLEPTVARFEINSIRGAGDIASFDIEGIFIDNFYLNARINGEITSTARNTSDNANTFQAGYINGLHTWYGGTWGSAEVNSLIVTPHDPRPNAHPHLNRPWVWSYQVFARSHDHTHNVRHPNIVVRLSNIVLTDGTPIDGDRFVTVGNFTDIDNNTPLRYIFASHIYRLEMIEFDSRALSRYPNDNLINAQVQVIVANWGRDVVRPNTPFSQPNPRGGFSCPDDTHYFDTPSAIGGTWDFTYRWERREVGSNTWVEVGTGRTLPTSVTRDGAYYRRIAFNGSSDNVGITSDEVFVGEHPRMTNFPNYIEVNGVIWSTRNVGAPGTFVDHPADRGMLFQWNRMTAWSSTDPKYSIPANAVWGNQPESGAEWYIENDPCPDGWRVPTHQEFYDLIRTFSAFDPAPGALNNIRGQWLNVPAAVDRGFGCQTGRLFNTYEDKPFHIFFPATGHRNEQGVLASVGTVGHYWGRTFGTHQPDHAFFNELTHVGATSGAESDRSGAQAMPIRCVKIQLPQISQPAITTPLPICPGICTIPLGVAFKVDDPNVVLSGVEYIWQSSPTGADDSWTQRGTAQNLTTNAAMFGNNTELFFRRIAIWEGVRDTTNVAARYIPPITRNVAQNPSAGVPLGGLQWATHNIDLERGGGFVAREADFGMYFQWGRPYGWRSTLHDTDHTANNFVPPATPPNVPLSNPDQTISGRLPGQRWNPAIGGWQNITLEQSAELYRMWRRGAPSGYTHTPNLLAWPEVDDPCRLIGDGQWRLPTTANFQTLINQTQNRWIPALDAAIQGFGCYPGYVFGTAADNYMLFFPATGFRNPGIRRPAATYNAQANAGVLGGAPASGAGFYHTATPHQGNLQDLWALGFSFGGNNQARNHAGTIIRTEARPLRCVRQ